jgi:hypothetical protein
MKGMCVEEAESPGSTPKVGRGLDGEHPYFVEGRQAGKVHFGTGFTSAVSDLRKGDSET